MRENKKLKFLMIVVILLAIILCFSLSLCHNADNNNERLDNDENAVQWNGKQTLPTGNGEIAKAIEIPGFNELTFVANQTIQQVNFYNPENNDCYFQMNLYVANELVWKSENVQPGYGYYEIELSRKLKQGEYPAYLNIKCYNPNGEELNSANIRFDLYVT